MDDSPRCAAGKPFESSYNVAQISHQQDSTIIICSNFDRNNVKDTKVVPGCKLTATFPSTFGDMDFKSDDCLWDRSGNRYGCCTDSTTDQVPNPYYEKQPTQGILIFGVIETVGDGAGTTADYWAEVDTNITPSSGSRKSRRQDSDSDCVYATEGQELAQPDNIHFSDLPSSWAFKTAIHSTLTSCTYTNTAPTATATGTLSCPGLPSPVPCPPAGGGSQGVCFVGGFSLLGMPGLQFGGDIATSQLLASCEW
jgi:hypothetical protein